MITMVMMMIMMMMIDDISGEHHRDYSDNDGDYELHWFQASSFSVPDDKAYTQCACNPPNMHLLMHEKPLASTNTERKPQGRTV